MLAKWEISASSKSLCLPLLEIDAPNMDLNLTRDLIFFDIEATGLHVIRDRIIQLAMIKYSAKGKEPECTRHNPQGCSP